MRRALRQRLRTGREGLGAGREGLGAGREGLGAGRERGTSARGALREAVLRRSAAAAAAGAVPPGGGRAGERTERTERLDGRQRHGQVTLRAGRDDRRLQPPIDGPRWRRTRELRAGRPRRQQHRRDNRAQHRHCNGKRRAVSAASKDLTVLRRIARPLVSFLRPVVGRAAAICIGSPTSTSRPVLLHSCDDGSYPYLSAVPFAGCL